MSRRRNRGRVRVKDLLEQAKAALGRRHWSDAEAVAELVLRHQPHNYDAWVLKSNVLAGRQDVAGQRAALERALALCPTHPVAANNLSALLWQAHDAAGAVAVAERALAAHPDHAGLLNNYGNALRDLNRFEDAIVAYDRALASHPESAEARFNRGLTYLTLGRDVEGWAGFEARWAMSSFRAEHARPCFETMPYWDGQPVADGRLLLWHEQGAGDVLQCLRWVPVVAARCQQPPIVEVSPELLRFVGLTLGHCAEVVAQGEPLPPYTVHAGMMSLPALCDAATSIPTWRPTVPQLDLPGAFRVGLCWAGNPRHPNDHNRSMPDAAIAPLLALDDVTWYSLQVGPRALPADHADPRLVDLAPYNRDFLDSAHVMAGLDLVVTVDTATAHLAGVLGLPTWLLVADVSDWRWRRTVTTTPWYPTMRLWRQARAGDWLSLVDLVRDAIATRLPQGGLDA